MIEILNYALENLFRGVYVQPTINNKTKNNNGV